MDIALISSTKDVASVNIKEQLLNNFDFKQLNEKFDNNPIFQLTINEKTSNGKNNNDKKTSDDKENYNKDNNKENKNNNKIIRLYTINSELIFTDDLDKKINAEIFVFLSKHRAEEGRASLTVHPIGNFGKNEKGGKEKTLCTCPSFLLKNIFIELNKNVNGSNYEATLEATHHGPFIEKPVLFLELGSNENYWKDKNGALIVGKSLISAIEKFNNIQFNNNFENNKNFKLNNSKINKKGLENNQESTFVIGGSHYNHVANKAMLKTDFSVGHILPKHNLEYFDEDILNQLMTKILPKPKFVLLDWKGMGKEKQRVLDLLKNNNIKYERSDKFFE